MLFKTGLLDWVSRAAHAMRFCSGLAALVPFSAIAAGSVTLAWDPTSGTNIAGYKIYYGAASHAYTNTINAGNVTNATISSLISGAVYYFAATAYDTSALESDYSTEVAYTNQTIVPPTIVLSSPATGASYAAPAAVNLAATVNANGHTITKVQFYNGATLLAEGTSAPYTFAWAAVGVGSYSLTAQAVYDSGSTVASTAANVTVTNVPLPSIALTAPANGASYTAPAAVNLAATVTANGHTITKVQFYNGATLLAEDTAAPYGFSWTSVDAGSYSLTARAVYDSGSTVASTPANVTVAAARPVNIAPAISAIADQTMATNSTQRLVRFTVTDPQTPASQLTVTATSDNPTLVPNEGTNLVLTSDAGGTNCTLAIIPTSGGTGQVDITITVSDGSVSTNATFHLSITEQAAWTVWWENTGGYLAVWSMSGTNLVSGGYLAPKQVDPIWKIRATMDLNGDGKADLLWQCDNGSLAGWFMDGTNSPGGAYLTPAAVDPSWKIVGTGDFNGDGKTDILWENTGGYLAVWYMDGTNSTGGEYLNPSWVDPSWKIVGTGDFDGDGKTDILWQNTGGSLAVWFMNGINQVSGAYLTPAAVDPSWKIVGTGDFNGDGKTDILWQNSGGYLAVWYMDGIRCVGGGYLNPACVDPSWKVVGAR